MRTPNPDNPTQREHISAEHLAEFVKGLEPRGDKPAFVAISGFGGSGKSTLATRIGEMIGEEATVVPIDNFIIGARDERSEDWHTFDRERLDHDVIQPARIGEILRYQRYNSGDWVNNRGGDWVETTVGRIIIIEGCGILHPALMPAYDLSAWIDLPQYRALESAKYRDASEVELFGDDDTVVLWDEVWGPNDKDFLDNFRPDLHATVLIEPQF
ncbi:MAG: hypothetical protein ABIQ89_01505 [Candidatus Saccharimonadales bacterium]